MCWKSHEVALSPRSVVLSAPVISEYSFCVCVVEVEDGAWLVWVAQTLDHTVRWPVTLQAPWELWFGWLPLTGLSGYPLHLDAALGSTNLSAPPPDSSIVDEFK